MQATPKGRLTTRDGQSHRFLFWESGLTEKPLPLTEGFVVSRAELPRFLERSVQTLGLDARETADFMEFWLSRMALKPWAAIRFVPREEVDLAAPLEVSPVPESVIRVLVDFRALDAPIVLKPQVLVPATRHGFAVVEWGGLLYK